MARILRPEALETDMVLEYTTSSRGWATPHQLWAAGTHRLTRADMHLALSCESLGGPFPSHILFYKMVLRSSAHRLTCQGSETQWKEGPDMGGTSWELGKGCAGGQQVSRPQRREQAKSSKATVARAR